MELDKLIYEARFHSNPERIPLSERYLQVFKGGYGFGDVIWAIPNPVLRNLSKKYQNIEISEAYQLLEHQAHEIRLLALFILEIKAKKKTLSEANRKLIAIEYLKRLKYVNNWDLVDASAHKLLGPWVEATNQPEILLNLAHTNNLWENRVAIMGTYHHIRLNNYELTLQISDILLHHKHDLIHKAVGWMLREIGNRNLQKELEYLSGRYKNMPRTMLRYAIEKFDEPLRQAFLKSEF